MAADSQTWYEIEYSEKAENAWYSSGVKADTEQSIQVKLEEIYGGIPGFEYRIVKKTLTTEVLHA